MGRCGYSDDLDNWDLIRWRGRVASATRGKRGQKLLKELRDALDSMPRKRLIGGEFVTPDGEACALGVLAVAKKMDDPVDFDSSEHEWLADFFDVAPCLIQEIEFVNDEYGHSLSPVDGMSFVNGSTSRSSKR